MIELKIDEFKGGVVIFHISRQDKEDYEKLEYKPFSLTFSDGKKYVLKSVSCPECVNRDFFVRGCNSSKDNTKMIVKFTEFLKIFELVKEYNKTS